MQNEPKSAQLQIRVSAAQKAAIQRQAERAGLDMSAYVLSRVLSLPADQFQACVAICVADDKAEFGFTELDAFLRKLSAAHIREALASAPLITMTPYVANFVAALVELACARHEVSAPAWTHSIAPLPKPVFGSALLRSRLHLLSHSPPPFRRRNIFVDSGAGAQV
jgi:uncharacterized protein (DUF1778 family)